MSDDGKRRVDVFERGNGTFGFEELRYDEEEQVWYTSGCYTQSFTASADDALREAISRVRWLAEAEQYDYD